MMLFVPGLFLVVVGCGGGGKDDTNANANTDTDTDTAIDTGADVGTNTGSAGPCMDDRGDGMGTAYDLGLLGEMGTICGDTTSTGIDFDWNFTADEDWLAFTVPTAGVWEFTLRWVGETDMNMNLLDSTGEDIAPAQANQLRRPETIYAELDPAETYYLQVGGASGPGADWDLDWEVTTIDPDTYDWMYTSTQVIAGDFVDGSFVGTMTWTHYSLLSDDHLCTWQFDAMDWDTDTTAVGADPFAAMVCGNTSGVLCEVAETVTFTNGAEVAGDCARFGLPSTATTVGLGYHFDADYWGIPVGPSAMYYLPENGEWIPLGLVGWIGLYDSVSGAFRLDFPTETLYGY